MTPIDQPQGTPMPNDDPLVLHVGRVRAHIYPALGGRLGQLDLGTGPLLRGYDNGLPWSQWGCYPLVPWSNRLPGGKVTAGRTEFQLPINNPDGSAIHGLGAACPWQVVTHDSGVAVLAVALSGGPYDVEAEQRFELSETALHLELRVANRGAESVPAGLGIHPWFHAGPVRLPADLCWPGEPLPTGAPVPVSGTHDLRRGVTPTPMDACFTGLTARSAEIGDLRLTWEGPVTNVVVYSGQVGWVCVEPVTMANNGFALARQGVEGTGVQVLAPGDDLRVAYTFERVR